MTPASFNGKILPADRVKSIHDAIVANDIEQLRTIARSEDGLMCDWLRRQAWYVVHAILSPIRGTNRPNADSFAVTQAHTASQPGRYPCSRKQDLRDPIQISKDVERSLYYFPQGTVNSHLLLRICTATTNLHTDCRSLTLSPSLH
ncbi:hypothetical protein BC938DRAFT_477125 [Jimgerdemannia flammicorona]|uniref:Rab-GAP TBC domain-containing protein n=1 Tax=Jimgerdemannia flammicorona TaxID=994334 RepID=A0A433PBW2_9FUNG|nr:hypothetical protein BC938DRAFT_477125 [Jimgerdemannia flammicorona]